MIGKEDDGLGIRRRARCRRRGEILSEREEHESPIGPSEQGSVTDSSRTRLRPSIWANPAEPRAPAAWSERLNGYRKGSSGGMVTLFRGCCRRSPPNADDSRQDGGDPTELCRSRPPYADDSRQDGGHPTELCRSRPPSADDCRQDGGDPRDLCRCRPRECRTPSVPKTREQYAGVGIRRRAPSRHRAEVLTDHAHPCRRPPPVPPTSPQRAPAAGARLP
jgi:hypothetical protein